MQVFQLVFQSKHLVGSDKRVCPTAPDVDHDRRPGRVAPRPGVRVERVHAYAASGHGHKHGDVDELVLPESLEHHLDAVQVDAVCGGAAAHAAPQHHVPGVVAGRQSAQHGVVIRRPAAVPVLQVHHEPVGQPQVGRRHQHPGMGHVGQQQLAQFAVTHLVREHHHRPGAQVLVDYLVNGPGQVQQPRPIALVQQHVPQQPVAL